MKPLLRAACALPLVLAPRLWAQNADGPYRNPALPVEVRVRDLLGRMTPEEKFWQLFMIPGSLDDPAHDYSHGAFGLQISAGPGGARAHAERINTIQRYFSERTRLGIPLLPFDEALHGVMREGATVFPQSIALAAGFDTALMGRVARAIAREAGSRGIRQVLSPVINLATDPRWGRVEETYGEDPLLTSRMGVTFVRAFESAGIVATPKHFVANVGDGGRDSYPIDLSRRLLQELHFPPFEAAIRTGGARSVMTAYNSVDGEPATQNPWLLRTVLRERWGFGGFVISDAAATGGATVLHHTEASTATAARHALEAGLDVIFQSSWEQHRAWLAAFRTGEIAEALIDSAVARVLRVKFGLGLFEDPLVSPDSAVRWNGAPEHRALAREAARSGMVLLKNAGGVLPLADRIRRIAVIGEDAAAARLGGYSGPGIAPVAILEGVRERAGARRVVRYAPGPGREVRSLPLIAAKHLSLRAEFFDNPGLTGTPVATRADSVLDVRWTFSPPARGLRTDWYGVRWSGTLTAPAGGVQRLGLEGNDGYRLFLDDRLLIDQWDKVSYRTRVIPMRLSPGSSHRLRIEFRETLGNGRLRLLWDTGDPDPAPARLREAALLAAGSDLAIVVVGLEEGEFRDRAGLRLPGRQEELIRRVAATGTPVVVVMVGGSAVIMEDWLDRVAGVLMAWYPGEEGGHAVADLLFGDFNPAGRLPITFPIAEGQLPLVYNHKPTGRGDDYLDLTGQPRFPFGFGLSYTTFEYTDLRIEPREIGPDGRVEVRVRVKNTGSRAGDEVAMLYLRDVLASVARPVASLAGFERIHLLPGATREVTFSLGPAELGLWDRELRWVVEPGTFRLGVGPSSRNIRLRGEVVVR